LAPARALSLNAATGAVHLSDTWDITLLCLHRMACHAAPCRYFLEPKPALMEHLEEAMRNTDADLKRITATRDAVAKAQAELQGELQELMKTMR
jgi:hypothetical protein